MKNKKAIRLQVANRIISEFISTCLVKATLSPNSQLCATCSTKLHKYIILTPKYCHEFNSSCHNPLYSTGEMVNEDYTYFLLCKRE